VHLNKLNSVAPGYSQGHTQRNRITSQPTQSQQVAAAPESWNNQPMTDMVPVGGLKLKDCKQSKQHILKKQVQCDLNATGAVKLL